MNGKIIGIGLLAVAVIAGGGMWYLQEYHFYDRLDPSAVAPSVVVNGALVPLATNGVEAIDAGSSPLRWRACFTLAEPLPAGAQAFDQPTPLGAPAWFDCFDYAKLTRDLESGAATAYLSQPEIRPDVDRVIAVYPDGRAFGWHQYNDKTPERGVMD